MRSTLYLKFTFIYIIFGFLIIFTTATLTNELLINKSENDASYELYQQANIMAAQVLPDYFSEELSASATMQQLHGLQTYLDAAIWLLDSDGNMLLSSNISDYSSPPAIIEEFNPAESGSSYALIGNYHDYLSEKSITVIAPVTQSYYIRGYLMIHKPHEDITIGQTSTMGIIYLTLAIVYLLSIGIMLAFHFLIYVPLRKITEAATQYASGNLTYEIPVYTQDEMGYLSASLNYMTSQLNDIENYQKKFIGNVSHDFRSPLTSIKGYIMAMVDGTIPPELHEKYLKIILGETDRLTDLTQDLLALNEFDTKELLLNKEAFDIQQLLKDVATSFEGICKQKLVKIELILESKPLVVSADKRKIHQVLYNLIDNAIKFSNTNSSIDIETSIVNGKAYIAIKDYGIGIPKSDINKIWDRFYKSDASRGKDKKGTGLGLAIVKEIVQAHGEHINIISTEGVGTQFVFSLALINQLGT